MYGNEVKMTEIIRIESKRILSKKVLWTFLLIVALFSACSTYTSLRRYVVPDVDGVAVTWQENLAHTRESLHGKTLDRKLIASVRQQENLIYADENSLSEIVRLNYEGKTIRELTDEEMDSFYQTRLSRIRTMLEENQYIRYTQEEKEYFLQKAKQLSEIPFGYAEGWKALNRDLGTFAPLLLIVISVLLLPLFGTDPKVSMNELYRSSRYGKKPLDTARILTAFIAGPVLYFLGMVLFFAIKMIPFGLDGGNQYIQSNTVTFLSLYNITYLQQFFINAAVGFIALLFVICLLLLITAVMEKTMNSAAVSAFFWVTLLLFDQMYLWPVNHYFANFMPLRLTAFSHYYTGNEVYRIFGFRFSVLSWSVLLSGLLAGVMLLLTVMCLKAKRRKGYILSSSFDQTCREA